MNLRRGVAVRSAASLAAALLLSPGCGSDDAGTTTGGAGSGGAGASATGAGGTSSATGMTTGSMATGTGGASTSTGAAGGGCGQWYCDLDQDGYGDPNVSVISCDKPFGGDAKCPSGYTESGTDCGPLDQSAHPDQKAYFSTPVISPGPALPFDYNCDGMVEKDPSQLYNGGMNLDCTNCSDPMPSRGYGPNANCGGNTEYHRCVLSAGMCMLQVGTSPGAPSDALRCR
jgi:hypothetical protein